MHRTPRGPGNWWRLRAPASFQARHCLRLSADPHSRRSGAKRCRPSVLSLHRSQPWRNHAAQQYRPHRHRRRQAGPIRLALLAAARVRRCLGRRQRSGRSLPRPWACLRCWRAKQVHASTCTRRRAHTRIRHLATTRDSSVTYPSRACTTLALSPGARNVKRPIGIASVFLQNTACRQVSFRCCRAGRLAQLDEGNTLAVSIGAAPRNNPTAVPAQRSDPREQSVAYEFCTAPVAPTQNTANPRRPTPRNKRSGIRTEHCMGFAGRARKEVSSLAQEPTAANPYWAQRGDCPSDRIQSCALLSLRDGA